MNLKSIVLAILLLTMGGCFVNKNKKEVPLSGKLIETLVKRAFTGDRAANDSLSNIYDTLLPPPFSINQIIIDSLKIGSSKFFSVIAEFENPIYNVFAVYDSALSLKLIDKSLNGYLTQLRRSDSKRSYWEVYEEFKTKNTLSFKRYNLYYIGKDTISKSLRTVFEVVTPSEKIVQDIVGFADDVINTKLYLSSNSTLRETWDTYVWNDINFKYESQLNIFDSVVTSIFHNTKSTSMGNEIRDKISAYRSLGVEVSADSINTYNNFKNSSDRFTIFLPEGWRALKNVMVTKQLKKEMPGSHFISNTLGASFSVVKIGETEKAEDYFTIPLTSEVKGNYTVRFSERIATKKNFIQCFEVSCINLKYLVIFECPILTYTEHKEVYEDIMNSFGVDC
ncbi:MAG: hypothetical protein KF721_13280 [Ignavibacteriaceae bacterium]|nr:hypothetical protein [Ignavibacteriaceae bacterium]